MTRICKALALALTAVALTAPAAAADWPVCVEKTTVWVANRPVTVERWCFPPE